MVCSRRGTQLVVKGRTGFRGKCRFSGHLGLGPPESATEEGTAGPVSGTSVQHWTEVSVDEGFVFGKNGGVSLNQTN